MYVVYTNALAFQPIDETGRAKGDEEIVQRGKPVPDYVLPFQLNALANAGMIVEVGDRPDPAIYPASAEPRVLASPDAPPGPSGPALTDLSGDAGGAGATQPAVPLERPKANDSRPAWEDYGASLGMDRLELEAQPNKQAVIDAVSAHEAVN
jgi:hypothetical protein